MKLENTKAQMRKGVLEFCILSMLQHKDAYASELIEQLKQAQMIVVEGTLYPLLTRLKNAGLLAYRWEESTAGPPRKYYFITNDGKIATSELQETWNKLYEAVQYATKTSTK